ncbi:variable surface protein [Plasmodium gonderi]|uniref:Variable surface protein n=1 Tax=Plasmodium gonderi TaxID=77519 RepID=A0A1Y1JP86_PLAGO|nr:variable surface protein [Plasmodium gonderi]GAW84291.1 variable surface protein [Plasmodium gonderi]
MLMYLSFKDIFPTCQHLYYSVNSMYNTAIKKKLEAACNKFNQDFSSNTLWYNNLTFVCLDLGLYLYKIKDKRENDRKPYYNFFIYELKRLVRYKNLNRKINSFVKLHEEIKNAYKNAGLENIDVCNEYVSLMDDHLVYEIFEMFDKLYKNFKYFNVVINKDQYVKECLKAYEKIIEKDKKDYNNFVQKELHIFKSNFHDYLLKNPYKCDDKLLNHSLMTPPEIRITAEELSGDIAPPVTWTSTGVFLFCNINSYYTAYGSYLRPRKRKLKNMWKRKNKKHYELMNLFEQSQKNIIQNNHNILYNSVD